MPMKLSEWVTTIVVEHRDRLTRFGFEFLEAALRAQGRRILVVEEKEIDDALVRDMTEVTHFPLREAVRQAFRKTPGQKGAGGTAT